MDAVIADISKWLDEGEQVALATVVSTYGSSPRQVGAKMAFTPAGKIAGSVSGGCVENAVYGAGIEALGQQRGCLLHYSVTDEAALEVGLACGGQIDVLVQPLDPNLFQRARTEVEEQRPVALATILRGQEEKTGFQVLYSPQGKIAGNLGAEIEEQVQPLVQRAFSEGHPLRSEVSLPSAHERASLDVFVDVILPPPTLVIIGGVHISIALASIAKALGYRTVILDPRRAFGNPERFPHTDQIIQLWPDEAFQQVKITRSTAVAVLTHDPKIDDPALMLALDSPAFYVGVLGSRKTQAKRKERLLKAGIAEEKIDHIHGPIGLDLGGRSPEELALAIMAEIVATRNQKCTGSFQRR